MSITASPRNAKRSRARRSTRLVTAGACGLLILLSGCAGNSPSPTQSGDPVPNLDAGGALAWQPRPTIVQTLRLLNPGLRQGDTLRLESMLRNVSDRPVSIEYVVCELDIEGDLRTEAPFILCAAYSARSTLGPGEQVTGRLERRVSSPPGRYGITIGHLLDPAVRVPAELTIHP
jgi:hypothetical protein